MAAALTFLVVPGAHGPELSRAEAAVAVAVTLDELVSRSTEAVVATAVEKHSRWEEVAGSRRIVTYTKLAVLQRAFGPDEKELWVRTLGGAVDRIGQQVSGEASLQLGRRSLLLLTRTTGGVVVVTEMAQGHYPIEADGPSESDGRAPGAARLRVSRQVGAILRRRGPSIPASEVLHGKEPGQAIALLREARKQADARQKR